MDRTLCVLDETAKNLGMKIPNIRTLGDVKLGIAERIIGKKGSNIYFGPFLLRAKSHTPSSKNFKRTPKKDY